MYIINGIAYAKESVEMLEIIHMKILDDRMLLLTFNTGEKRLFDAANLQGPVFEPLSDMAVFNMACLDDGVVTWLDGKIDCAPEYMYEHSYEYDELFAL